MKEPSLLNRASKPNRRSNILLAVAAFGALAVNSCSIQATPLRLDYLVNPNGSGGYSYEFKLLLDNHDGSFSVGQSWNWIVFGDNPSGPSVLDDFSVNSGSFPIGPFTSLPGTVGGHNGPSFIDHQPSGIGPGWAPSLVGDYLQWAGVSSGFLDDGQMLFSVIFPGGGASAVSFEAAHRVTSFDASPSPVPESGPTATLMAITVAALAFAGKWRRAI